MDIIRVKDMIFADAYVQIFDLLDDCIMVVDIESNLILYNKASEKLDGFKREDILGKPLREVYKVSRYSSSTLKCLETKEPVKDMYQNYLTNKGKNISSISSSYPLIKDNKMTGVITITKDMTRYEEMMKVFRVNDTKEVKYSDGRTNYTFSDIVGNNKELNNTLKIAKTAAKTNSNILLYGETGTGKELYAQSIHNESGVSGKFVSINCAAIPENLLEGMLFGTAKGAYTGAVDKAGLFEEAMDGTLFLDELNSMSLNLQSKLLRAVETGKIRRVGETKEKLIKPRIVTALNIHPFEAIEENILRRDLYYRLGVVTVSIPPLRDRKDDIEELLKFFIGKFNKKYSKNILGVTENVLELFKIYNWPGNVRELEHNIEHSIIIMEDKKYIEVEDLPSFIKESIENMVNIELDNEIREKNNDKKLDNILEDIEYDFIVKTLQKNDNNVSQAAKELGLSRQTLDYRIKKFNIKI